MNKDINTVIKSSDDIMRLLSEADIATLTLVLSQLTNNLKYLELIRPYVKGAFDYAVKVPEEVSFEIKKELINFLKNKSNKNKILTNISNIKDEDIKELMSVGVGEKVPEEYISIPSYMNLLYFAS